MVITLWVHTVQDLERQVRLRLGLGLDLRENTKEEETSERTVGHQYPTRHRDLGHHQLNSPTTLRPDDHTASPRDHTASHRDEEDGEGEGKGEAERRMQRRTKKREVRQSRNIEQHSGNHRDKLELFQYLSK